MKGNFKTLLRRFCLEGSVLGLKYFYLYPDPVSRCFWGITLLLCGMGACLLTLLLHRRFMETPTHITIENQFEPIYNLPYPAITLCSPNQITASAVEHFKQTLVVSVMSLLAQNCNTFLKRCFFQNKLYPCEELFEPVLTKLGVCCAFNSIYKFVNNKRNEKKPNFIKHKSKINRLKHGLTVIVDYDPYNAVDGTVQHAGATRIVFTDWSEFPLEVESVLAHPGIEAFLLISATYTYCSEEVATLPIDSRKCVFEDEVILPHFWKYHHTDCELNCLVSKVESECHCVVFYVPNVSPHQVCNFTKIPCITDVKYQMTEESSASWCGCQRDCVSRRYSVEHFNGNLQAVQHVRLDDRYSGVVLNESTTVMHFFFPKTSFVRQKQETVMSLTNFVSNLGGVFGLCLGCSFISLFEICFYIYTAIKNHIRRRTTRRRRRIGYYN
ncbi:Sodium channel protein Nach [Papilio xuthus]|uniref:Sodium channel protein Nach n=1 Tax=Papilio xuthus TaxID=66420 RepID=A0A194PHA1_PAPXU|nr:Sodium channel protein Nach [Papilio xuthus]